MKTMQQFGGDIYACNVQIECTGIQDHMHDNIINLTC
jgi:hypothetical protein